jgi:hypothetical protein
MGNELFVKGADVNRKFNKRYSEPNDIVSSEMVGDVLFIKGVDVIQRTH